MPPLSIEAPREIRRERDAWVISKYAGVAAALRNPLLPASIDTPSEAEPARDALRQSAASLFSPEKMSGWKERFAALAGSMFGAAAQSDEIDLVQDAAIPWARQVAVLVVEADPGFERAEQVFLAAACPDDAQLAKSAAEATGEMARSMGYHEIGLRIQAFVALAETLPAFLGNAWLALLRRPDQIEAILLPSAIDELLRFAGPARALPRQVAAEVDLGDVRAARGDRVILAVGSANRDPEEFADPNRLDLRRSIRNHLAFGAGRHACLGAALIRLAAGAALGAFADHFAGFELAGEPEMRAGWAICSLARLPARRPLPLVAE